MEFIIIGLYFLPSIIAYNYNRNKFLAVLFLNILLGWTGLGWVGSLVLSVLK